MDLCVIRIIPASPVRYKFIFPYFVEKLISTKHKFFGALSMMLGRYLEIKCNHNEISNSKFK